MVESIQTRSAWIIPFDSDEATLAAVGGKGANLARLARAGFPVPAGFVVSTNAYQAFVHANGLEERIQRALAAEWSVEAGTLETLSEQIRAMFREGVMPGEVWADLAAAYQELGQPAVAVRSSATAEDLPDMSFAGQQDTYLNVRGEAALKDAVVACWSSLWTARAMGYRAHNNVPHSGTALAVVVQTMVESQASGVLFTANPLTGLRSETVIDATLGLGEALVSGQVEPDHYVVDTAGRTIQARVLGAKALSIRGAADGGTRRVAEDARGVQALPDEQILALADMGVRVAQQYGFPQDIEWAWAGGRLHLLQSRPITSLYPAPTLPETVQDDRLRVYFSFAAVQGMLDPMTPLGRDAMKQVFSMGATLFGYHFTPQTQTVLLDAGERLWVNLTPIFTNSVGRKIVRAAVGLVEPTVGQALERIWDEPQLQPGRAGIRFAARRRLAGFLLPLVSNVALNLLFPERRREAILANGERILDELRELAWRETGETGADRWERLGQRVTLLERLAEKRLPAAFVLFVSGVASGMAAFNLFNRLAEEVLAEDNPGAPSGWHDQVLEATRGLPHNPTTEMDLSLWATARVLRSDAASRAEFAGHSPAELALRYQAGELPGAAQRAVADFLARYGARGLAEIDTGRERWREDPRHVFEVLNGYLQIEDAERAPDAVFQRSARQAEAAIADLAARLRRKRHGWLKVRLLRFAARRMRALMSLREAPKFFAVRMLDTLREELLKSGRELAAAGDLEKPDDLFYLTQAEIQAFAGARGQGDDWRGRIAARREDYRRELLRRQVPRLLLSDGRAFYEGIIARSASGAGEIVGSPVSPGSVEGRVRVVLDPRQAGLLPGEILVCPGTDPSWTPLFLSAGGLVMEVGGMMTHGAVVAREYGIPAIVGVDQATRRLKTGQRIRMDGSTGEIEVQEE